MSRDGDVSGVESQLRLTLPRDYTLIEPSRNFRYANREDLKNAYKDTQRNGKHMEPNRRF